ncbi:S1 family peptidase [Microvirga lupini]|uniref:S1 family peptidase n=1 Tax=Microvirga lupini TaxID=420324 RepID=UPI003CCD803B
MPGQVTALSRIRDVSRSFQISAPVRAGNSGGPLLDRTGNIVGVVSAKLNPLNLMVIPERQHPTECELRHQRGHRCEVSWKAIMYHWRRVRPCSRFRQPISRTKPRL